MDSAVGDDLADMISAAIVSLRVRTKPGELAMLRLAKVAETIVAKTGDNWIWLNGFSSDGAGE